MARLQGKVIFVTGAAGTIGEAVCAAVRREGGLAISSDLRGQGDIDHVLDVTAEEDWRTVLATVDTTHGWLDGLVNAAGIVSLGSVEDMDYSSWRRVLAVNLD